MVGIYFNAFDAIENHNSTYRYELVIEIYWVTHSGYFILATTVAFSVGVTDTKILFCRGISEKIRDKKTSMIY